MNRRSAFYILVIAIVALLPFRSPAPLVYVPGEGWTYEPVGAEGRWKRSRAKDQLDVAEQAFDAKDYSLALKASRHLVRNWPLSDYAPEGQYLVGRCYEAKHKDEKAFKEYQVALHKYPRNDKLEDVQLRQFEIANRFLGGQWFKLWNTIPLYPSMSRTAGLFEQIVESGPYSAVGPQAQLHVGEAREKGKDYTGAVKAYERAADRYSDRPEIAAEAIYRAGMAWNKQAKTAEYDQGAAGQAIATLTDFMVIYPDDKRMPDVEKTVGSLRAEQARGSFEIARFYEKRKKWNGALIYYNEVLLRDPDSPLAPEARTRIEAIKKRIEDASQ
ncbi:MAG TPA: outer membrane protein assembly factor BamD [Verrucomicrobiota bacterium]|nr:outer membrane protein assembly factor BamD [Verrucomicrobiota bacterium]